MRQPDGRIEVVQCKYWSRTRQIHEKHIFQLHGTVVAYRVDYPQQTASGTFVTSTTLTERAHLFATMLSIAVHEERPLEPYPCIKCNVSQWGLIYHLPFDQQYDRTDINASKGKGLSRRLRRQRRSAFAGQCDGAARDTRTLSRILAR